MPEPPQFAYQVFLPSHGLDRFVEHLWALSSAAHRRTRREILIPNGRPLLLLSLGTPSTRIDPITGERMVTGSSLQGILTRPFVVEQLGESRLVGVQLRPHGLATLCGREPLVDQAMPIETWLGGPTAAALTGCLLAGRSPEARVAELDNFLSTRPTRTDYARLPALESAIDHIEGSDGEVNVEELAARLHMTYVTLYRTFKNLIGIGPKTFADITRYYRFVGGLLADSGGDSIALLASLRGYYDQAHASRDFRRFTGVTPTTFRSTLNGIAALMHQC